MSRPPRTETASHKRITVRVSTAEHAAWSALAAPGYLGDWVRDACAVAAMRAELTPTEEQLAATEATPADMAAMLAAYRQVADLLDAKTLTPVKATAAAEAIRVLVTIIEASEREREKERRHAADVTPLRP